MSTRCQIEFIWIAAEGKRIVALDRNMKGDE